MSKASNYTDEDVQAAAVVVKLALDYRYPDPDDIAAQIVKTIAPAIAARALREAARTLPGFNDTARWLRDLADEIEAGR